MASEWVLRSCGRVMTKHLRRTDPTTVAKVLSCCRWETRTYCRQPSPMCSRSPPASPLRNPQFALQVLTSLKALFAVKEPPENMMVLLNCCMGSAITQSFGSRSCRLCTTR